MLLYLIIYYGYNEKHEGVVRMTKNETRKIKKGIELLELFISDLGLEDKIKSTIVRRDSFYHVFYNGERFDELFLSIIPVERIEVITRTLLQIRTSSSYTSTAFLSTNGSIEIEPLRDILNEFLGYLKNTLIKFGFTVFYSWQTDTSSALNRNFIENSLEKAIKNACEKSNLPFQLDKDTVNREGSPDIAQTILDKIDECLLFVADVSISGEIETETGNIRLLPNSNVMYELGYAHGVLGENNIIMVFNDATGDVEKLPFDLRGRRILRYKLDKRATTEEKSEEKKRLISHLTNTILRVANTQV